MCRSYAELRETFHRARCVTKTQARTYFSSAQYDCLCAPPGMDNFEGGTGKSTWRTLNLALLAVGLVLLVVLVVRLDTATVAERLRLIGWYFVPAFACYMANVAVSALSWRACIDPSRSIASRQKTLQAFWAGHAINTVTPGGSVGEVAKGSLLSDQVEPQELTSSILVHNVINTGTLVASTLLGAFAAFFLLDVSARATGPLLVGATVVFGGFALAMRWVRRGMVGQVVALVERMPWVRLNNTGHLADKARVIDQRMAALVQERPANMWRAVGLSFGVRALQVGEVWFLLSPLMPGGDVLLIALLLQTTSQLISWMTAFVPAGIGVIEGGGVGLFQLAGLDPVVAFTVLLARRARMVLGTSIGLVLGSGILLGRRSPVARH